MSASTDFISLNIAVMTVSDSRDQDSDTSGKLLESKLISAGHNLHKRVVVRDDIYQIRAVLSGWIADEGVDVVITTGGTGFSGRDSTPEAVDPLLDKKIDGFGELFRSISHDEIGSSTIQSRALAGMSNNTVVFCVPGSTGACETAWDNILESQLDSRFKPCNFAMVIRRNR
jgi:molybdenum cofactor biosynthesis protein B